MLTTSQDHPELRLMGKTGYEFDQVFATLYEELRRIAGYFRRGQTYATMSATDLLDETYLKLRKNNGPPANDRLHFKRIAARAMRQILTDAARHKETDRGGGLLDFVSLTHDDVAAPVPNPHLLDLHRSLDALAEHKPRLAEIIEMRYFGGFTVEEVRACYGVSDATIERDIRQALTWLKLALERMPRDRKGP